MLLSERCRLVTLALLVGGVFCLGCGDDGRGAYHPDGGMDGGGDAARMGDGTVTGDGASQRDGMLPSDASGAGDGSAQRDAVVRPDAGTCPATLTDRIEQTSVSVAPDSVNMNGGGYFSRLTPPVLAPYQGGAQVAWGDSSGKIHVTPINDLDQRAGQDVTQPGNEIRGLAAHSGGFAVLFQRGEDEMAIVGYDAAGNQTFDTLIVGNNSHDNEGDKWIRREWGDHGRLSFDGSRYAVYFGHVMNWGSQGIHQGDLLWYYDLSGSKTGGAWDWGCSHSLDVRLGYDGQQFRPVCLSDCYPEKAIMYNHRAARIHAEPSGNCSGNSDAELGGLAVAPAGGFYLTFVSPEGRLSHDVAFVNVTAPGTVGPIHWLTDTAAVEESNAHLARYGDDFLVSWQGSGGMQMGLVDGDGNFLIGPEQVSVDFTQQTDFVNFAHGDVGWAHGAGSNLVIYRVRYCR